MTRPLAHPALADVSLDAVLHALSDPVRRQMVRRMLQCGELSCGAACDELPPSTVSFHHKLLREAGIIRSQKRGVQVFNTVRKTELDQRFPELLEHILRHDAGAADRSSA